MTDIEGVRTQIRFFLAQLPTRNEHHAFEALCQEVARARVCSNILPATGPVSSGGDQGRDFETFRTYLERSPLRDSAFMGRASEGMIVFACSTEKDPAKSKIRSDVDKIMASGETPERIYFFSSEDVPVGRRHAAQEDAWKDHGVRLEVFDAQALTDLLSDRQLFWVAEKYLKLPSDIYPPLPEEGQDGWYASAKRRWRDREPVGYNYQEFDEIRWALRHASRTERCHGDVFWWAAKLRRFREDGQERLSRKATYEVVVADLYAFGNIRGHEDEIRAYLVAAPSLKEVGDLKDAATFIYFCAGASADEAVDIPKPELGEQWRHLMERVDALLASDYLEDSPTARCALLETAGYLAFFPFDRPEAPVDPDTAMNWWEQLLVLAPRAPLYPLDSFSDFLTRTIELIGDHPRYPGLVRAFDELAGERLGEGAAGDKARQRALAWYEAGQPLRAIDELHVAKVKWFTKETLEGSVLSMLLIGEWYGELGLLVAAKHYYLAAAYVASRSEDADVLRRVPQALMAAAYAEYSGGAWLQFLILGRSGAEALAYVGSRDEEEYGERYAEQINRLAFGCTIILLFCERFALADLAETTRDLLRFMDHEEIEQEALPIGLERWKTAEELWESLREQLGGRPFGDAARTREIGWSALGLDWRVRFGNDHATAAGAEEFCAAAQVVAAELAAVDLSLLPTSVRVSVTLEKRAKPRLERRASNDGGEWDLGLPVDPTVEADGMTYEMRLTAMVLEILREASAVPSADFFAAVDRLFQGALLTKVFVGRPYRTLYRDAVDRQDFQPHPRSLPEPPGAELPFETKGHDLLAWRGGPGAGYDHEEAIGAVRRRYENSVVPVRHTLRRLSRNPGFRTLVRKLRSEGWKDWHILMALANLVITERLRRTMPPGLWGPEAQSRGRQILHEEETRQESESLPDSVFAEGPFRTSMNVGLLTCAQSFGLEIKQEAPDFTALERLLVERYRFKDDDVDHDPVFEYHDSN